RERDMLALDDRPCLVHRPPRCLQQRLADLAGARALTHAVAIAQQDRARSTGIDADEPIDDEREHFVEVEVSTFETSKSAETSRSLRSDSRCSRPFSIIPATWFAMVWRKSISVRSKSRGSRVWTFITPMTSSRDTSGTDSIEVKRSTSTDGTFFQRGSFRTSRTARGTRAFTTQPVMPSPTRSVARPTARGLSPFVATRRTSPSRFSRRYKLDTSARIASVVRSITM